MECTSRFITSRLELMKNWKMKLLLFKKFCSAEGQPLAGRRIRR
jgi:hypothetical protein